MHNSFVPRSQPGHRGDRLLELDVHRRCHCASTRSWTARASSAARAYLATELGAHRLLRRFPVGSGRRYRRPASATQFSTPKSRRMTHVANMFTHRVVYLTTDAMPSKSAGLNVLLRRRLARSGAMMRRMLRPTLSSSAPTRARKALALPVYSAGTDGLTIDRRPCRYNRLTDRVGPDRRVRLPRRRECAIAVARHYDPAAGIRIPGV